MRTPQRPWLPAKLIRRGLTSAILTSVKCTLGERHRGLVRTGSLASFLVLRIVAVGGALEVRRRRRPWPLPAGARSGRGCRRDVKALVGDVGRLVEWVVSDPLVDAREGAEAGWRVRLEPVADSLHGSSTGG